MNIFYIYLDKIKKIIIDQNKKGILKIPENLDSINVEIPPKQFDSDISTNVSMVLAKINKTQPIDLANKLTKLIKKSFSQRRKTIKNNLKKTKYFSDQILLNCKINANKRPEELNFNDFINLSNSFSNNKKIL